MTIISPRSIPSPITINLKYPSSCVSISRRTYTVSTNDLPLYINREIRKRKRSPRIDLKLSHPSEPTLTITKPRGELTINHSCHMTTLNVHGDPHTHHAHDHQRPLMTYRAQTLRSSRPRAFRACPLHSDQSHRSTPQSQCPNSRIK